MKPIRPGLHGLIDYTAALLLLLAPSVLNFTGTPALACFLLAAIIAGLTLMTRFSSGVVKLIPVHVHGGVDLVTAFVIAALPWLLGFSEQGTARTFFLAVAVLVFLVWLLTDWREQRSDVRSPNSTPLR